MPLTLLFTVLVACTSTAPNLSLVAEPEVTLHTGTVMDAIEIELPQADLAPWMDPTVAFDSDLIRIAARIIDPDGRVETVRGFYRQGYRVGQVETDAQQRPSERDVAEQVVPTGDDGWVVRYRPRQPGRHEIVITCDHRTASDQPFGQTIYRHELTAHARMPEAPRAIPYIHISPDHPTQLTTSHGDAAVMVGLNLCWMVGDRPLADFEHYLDQAQAAGVNWIRLWLAPDFVTTCLERKSEDGVPSTGAGRIDQRAAHRVDQILKMAEARGIYVQMCIESFNSLLTSGSDPFWETNALNADRGGPLQRPEAFFTDDAIQQLFRQRLDYLVARWGDYPSVFAWELWNEVDLTDGFWVDDRPVLRWHRSMGGYLKSIDPYGHPVTTSMSNDLSMQDIWEVPEIDIIQTHHYGGPDLAAVMVDLDRMLPRRFNKPHLVGEAGISHSGTYTAEADPTGIHLHQMLWSGLISPARATGMTWWWDLYVEPLNLWTQFQSVARFAEDMKNQRGEVAWLPNPTFTFDASTDPAADRHPHRATDLAFQGAMRCWKPSFLNDPVELQIQPNGTVVGREALTSVLHGALDPSGKANPVTFNVDYAANGTFEVMVHDISASAPSNITIAVDGIEQFSRDLEKQDGDHAGFSPQRFSVPIASGPHTITVTNEQREWASVEYALRGAIAADQPSLEGQAIIADLLDSDQAAGPVPIVCGWIRQRQWSWDHQAYPANTEGLVPIVGVQMTQTGLPDGAYRLVWFETDTGLPATGTSIRTSIGPSIGPVDIDVAGGAFTVPLPVIETDLAYKIYQR